jgi:hypothetical protein
MTYFLTRLTESAQFSDVAALRAVRLRAWAQAFACLMLRLCSFVLLPGWSRALVVVDVDEDSLQLVIH